MLSGKSPRIATRSGDTFLEVNPECGESILNITQENDIFDLTRPFELNSEEGKQVFPKPGYCIKSKTNEDVKVFINMCHSDDVPKPDEKLMYLRDVGDDDDDESIRFPLGLGLPRREKDKSGNECICFDVVINSEFLNTLMKDEDARSLVMSVCIEGIADKYGIIIRDDCCVKLTKPYHGTVQKHFVKNTDPHNIINPISFHKGNSGSSKSLVGLLDSSFTEDKISSDYSDILSVRPKNSTSKSNYPVQSKVDKSSALNKKPQSSVSDPSISSLPKKQKSDVQYGLFQIPASLEYPMLYVLEASLHYLADIQTQIKVFVSNNRVVIKENMHNCNIDICLPNPIIPERCHANFYDGILAVVLPLAHHNEENP